VDGWLVLVIEVWFFCKKGGIGDERWMRFGVLKKIEREEELGKIKTEGYSKWAKIEYAGIRDARKKKNATKTPQIEFLITSHVFSP